VSCIFLAQADGITGAAIAVVIGYVVDLAIRFRIGRSVLSARLTYIWPVRTMLATVLAYGNGFVAARIVNEVLHGVPGVPAVLAALAAGTVAYVVTLWGAGGVLSRDRRVLKTLFDRARNRSSDAAVRPLGSVVNRPGTGQ
jgi:hypothetical protein